VLKMTMSSPTKRRGSPTSSCLRRSTKLMHTPLVTSGLRRQTGQHSRRGNARLQQRRT
jgi:hypothetical protein